MKRYVTSKDILRIFLELLSLSNNIDEWSVEEFKDNEPRLLRYQQLIALFKAFKLPTDVKSFVNGSFIDGTNEKYVKTRAYMMQNNHTKYTVGNIIGDDIDMAFAYMLEYRMKLNTVLSHNQQILLASHSMRYAFFQINMLDRKIKENIEKYDAFLARVISPENENISIEEMVQSFAYIDVDMSEIDFKYM